MTAAYCCLFAFSYYIVLLVGDVPLLNKRCQLLPVTWLHWNNWLNWRELAKMLTLRFGYWSLASDDATCTRKKCRRNWKRTENKKLDALSTLRQKIDSLGGLSILRVWFNYSMCLARRNCSELVGCLSIFVSLWLVSCIYTIKIWRYVWIWLFVFYFLKHNNDFIYQLTMKCHKSHVWILLGWRGAIFHLTRVDLEEITFLNCKWLLVYTNCLSKC